MSRSPRALNPNPKVLEKMIQKIVVWEISYKNLNWWLKKDIWFEIRKTSSFGIKSLKKWFKQRSPQNKILNYRSKQIFTPWKRFAFATFELSL